MIYSQLYRKQSVRQPVKAALIGAGNYGTAVLTQSMTIPELHVSVVADSNIEAARRAFELAGVPGEEIVVCGSRAEALRALPGRRVIVEDPLLLMDLPIDVIAEATGIPEAGTRHAWEAIRHGKHVAMVSKEPDSAVGPILKHLADKAGLVYTAVDGDQHGLLMGWVGWLRSIGLEVVSAGKSRDAEAVFEDDFSLVSLLWDPNTRRAPDHDRIPVAPGERHWFHFMPDDGGADYVEGRRRALASHLHGRAGSFDLCETVIAANATGLVPDMPELHQPVARIHEIPRVLCPVEEGGILKRRGVIDLVTCLRGKHESGLGGGVFAVVSCENEYSRRTLVSKGLAANPGQTAAVIYRPHHLCGVETSTSLLCAALLGAPTGSDDYRPRFDLVVTSTRLMKAGEILDCDHDASLKASLVPALPVRKGGPLPANLANRRSLARDIPAGTVIARDMVEIPADSLMFDLRLQQDELFGVV